MNNMCLELFHYLQVVVLTLSKHKTYVLDMNIYVLSQTLQSISPHLLTALEKQGLTMTALHLICKQMELSHPYHF